MQFAIDNKDLLIRKYTIEKKSVRQIAKEYNTYPNKILRALKFNNIDVRDRSEATINAINEGRKIPPTAGKERTNEEKLKISAGRAEAWKNLTESEREDISNQSQDRWNAMTDEKKEEIQRLSHEAIRQTSKDGSKLEKYLHHELLKSGYDCFHHSKVLENEKLEVDLFIPSIKLAIEVDGPTHFQPIWGEESLQKCIKADSQKNGLLTMRGFVTCRLRLMKKSLSESTKREVLSQLLDLIKNVEEDNSPRVIYLEVK